MTNLHEPKMDSTLFLNPFQLVYMNFATKNLQACLCSAVSTVETISIIFSYLVIVYPQIQDPINLIYMSTTYLESFGADLTKNKPFQCVSILLTGMSTNQTHKYSQLTLWVNDTPHGQLYLCDIEPAKWAQFYCTLLNLGGPNR